VHIMHIIVFWMCVHIMHIIVFWMCVHIMHIIVFRMCVHIMHIIVFSGRDSRYPWKLSLHMTNRTFSASHQQLTTMMPTTTSPGQMRTPHMSCSSLKLCPNLRESALCVLYVSCVCVCVCVVCARVCVCAPAVCIVCVV